MKALIRKDLNWLSLFLGAGLGLITFTLATEGFNEQWSSPWNRWLDVIFPVMWVSGLVFGIFAALREELTRTTEFLLHRPVSPTKIFLVRTFSCLGIVVLWQTIPVLLHLGVATQSDNWPIYHPSKVLEYFALGTPTLCCFCLGYFAGTLPGNPLTRLILGGIVGFPICAITYRLFLPIGDGFESSLLLFVGYHLIVGAILLFAAHGNQTSRNDPDRPLSVRYVLITGGCLVAGGMVATGLGVAPLQDSLQRTLCGLYPRIIESTQGTLLSVTRHNIGRIAVDENHRPVKPQLVIEDKQKSTWSYFHQDREDNRNIRHKWYEINHTRFDGEWRHLGWGSNQSWVAYLHYPDGLITLTTFADRDRGIEPASQTFGKGKGNEPFSAKAKILDSSRSRKQVLIGDPEDGLIWSCHFHGDNPSLVSHSLPDGDRFKDWARQIAPSRSFGLRFWEQDDQPDDEPPSYGIQGHNNLYVYAKSKITVASPEIKEFVRYDREPPVVALTTDPISSQVELRNDRGEVVIRHDYALRTVPEKIVGNLCLLASLLRTPLFQWIGMYPSRDRSNFRDAIIFDPLITGGKRKGLVAGNLAIALLLSFIAHRRLKKMGTDRKRRWLWVFFILLGGLISFILYRFLETNRAHRAVHVLNPDEATPYLIKSA